MGIMQSPGANALEVSDQVRAVMKELSADFPSSVESRIAYDPTQFVRSSINAVIVTLLEAIALVVLVRSEEHTSELQSLMRISYAVFCLKKKTKITYNIMTHINLILNIKITYTKLH